MQLAAAVRTEVSRLVHDAAAARCSRAPRRPSSKSVRRTRAASCTRRSLSSAPSSTTCSASARRGCATAGGGWRRQPRRAVGHLRQRRRHTRRSGARRRHLYRVSGKCDRCWRHVPESAPSGVEGIRVEGDDWLYRGASATRDELSVAPGRSPGRDGGASPSRPPDRDASRRPKRPDRRPRSKPEPPRPPPARRDATPPGRRRLPRRMDHGAWRTHVNRLCVFILNGYFTSLMESLVQTSAHEDPA